MNKSECTKQASPFGRNALNVLSWNVAIIIIITTKQTLIVFASMVLLVDQNHRNVSMGIVEVKTIIRREVKFIDPNRSTKGESTWLGYTLCDLLFFIHSQQLFNECFHITKNLFC